jgi:hypothetical protein
MADTGNGATLTRTGFTVDIRSITIGNQTIDTLDVSLLSTTGFTEKISADLADAGTFTVEYLFDATDAAPALGGAAVTTTITFPVVGGSGTAATLAGTAILTDLKIPDLMNNELQVAQATFTWDGVTGPAFTAQS